MAKKQSDEQNSGAGKPGKRVGVWTSVKIGGYPTSKELREAAGWPTGDEGHKKALSELKGVLDNYVRETYGPAMAKAVEEDLAKREAKIARMREDLAKRRKAAGIQE